MKNQNPFHPHILLMISLVTHWQQPKQEAACRSSHADCSHTGRQIPVIPSIRV
jgi:hypothetical protein